MAERSPLIAGETRIPPARGLITAHNRREAPLRVRHLRQWLRYNRQVLNALKVDALANGAHVAVVEDLLPTATELGCALSLRTDGASTPPDLAKWKSAGLWDVKLCPASLDESAHSWLDACAKAEIPIRLQLVFSNLSNANLDTLFEGLAKSSVTELDFVYADDLAQNGSANAVDPEQVEAVARLIPQLEALNIRVTIRGLAFCALDESLWSHLANSRQNALDHAQTIPTSLTLARTIHGYGPVIGGKIIRMVLARHTLSRTPVDEILLPFLIKRSTRYLINRLIRRVTEHMNVAHSVPKALQRSKYEEVLQDIQEDALRTVPKACESCRLRRICDHDTGTPKSIEGELVVSPMHFCMEQPLHYDAIDMERLEAHTPSHELATEAMDILTQQSPTRAYTSADYKMDDGFSEQMEGGLKWWSVTNTEKLSSSLGTFKPPFTVSVEVGAGIADYMGFSFGRHCAIVCPMEAYRHTLSLHVDADGRYILLRDGKAIQPVEFEGFHHLPLHLGDVLQPRISLWNIDDCILTQSLRVWSDPETDSRPPAKYSIIIVSTKFTRRLQAVLHNIAHQQGIDLAQLEVIVAYVPGLDATDDLIDSMSLSFPELRVVRSAFPEHHAKAKGLMINESFKLAQGEWIMLLDSDTLLPPDYFSRIEEVADEEVFIAPDGRRLLTRETTARILMGEIKPWESWAELLNDEGEFRHRETRGIPVGFCQCFRAEYLDKHPYLEMDHFEIADMHFSIDVLKDIGKEHRLSGAPVLHLDHGGSQWYGTRKHM
ncbi:MAG: glycosyltransferase family 2 protein [Candidatus Hydrogenedentota bacterium]